MLTGGHSVRGQTLQTVKGVKADCLAVQLLKGRHRKPISVSLRALVRRAVIALLTGFRTGSQAAYHTEFVCTCVHHYVLIVTDYYCDVFL